MVEIALITDLHYSLEESDTEVTSNLRETFYENYLQSFFSTQVDKYILLGDLIHNGTKEELEGIYSHLSKYKKPFQHILGNHDTYHCPKEELLQYTGHNRYDYEVTDDGVLIYLDTTKDNSPNDWAGTIDREQFNWLKKIVEKYKTLPLYIFGHHPLHETTVGSDEYGGAIDPTHELYELMSSHQPGGVYLCGHCHAHSIIQKRQWYYVQTAAVYNHPVIRKISIKKGSVETQVIDPDNEQLTSDAESLQQCVFKKYPEVNPIGEEHDRTRKILLGSL